MGVVKQQVHNKTLGKDKKVTFFLIFQVDLVNIHWYWKRSSFVKHLTGGKIFS